MTDSFTYDNDGLLIGAGGYTIDRIDSTTGLSNDTGWAEFVTDSTVTITPTVSQFGEVSNMDYDVSTVNAADWALTFNGKGQIVSKADTVGGVTDTYNYTYNDLGQLTTVTDGVTTLESYTYDANGNRLTSWTTAQGPAGRYGKNVRISMTRMIGSRAMTPQATPRRRSPTSTTRTATSPARPRARMSRPTTIPHAGNC